MRCTSCGGFSWAILCAYCRTKLLRPSVSKRMISDGFAVYSFYHYEEIRALVDAKYYFYGDRVYNTLARLSYKLFAPKFDDPVVIVPIDDHTRHDFSQTAILARHFCQPNIDVKYGTLKATNHIKYAGKDLAYRQKHKRKFKYTGKSGLKVILVDDIVTTGLTILEAKQCLEQFDCEILFALTLSDAKD